MRTLQIQESFKHNQDVFLIVRKCSSIYKLNESYSILDDCQNYVTKGYIRSIKKRKVKEIDNQIAILDKNVNSDVHKEILSLKYNISDNDDISIIVFSTSRPFLNYD